jgi:ribosomal-protein-alanine N-acetyltransferase
VRIPPLATPRLNVRELRAADRTAVEHVAGGDRERWLEWTGLAYEQLDELRQPPYGERGIELRESGQLVGLVGLVPALGPFGLLPSWPEPGGLYRPVVGVYGAVAPEHRRRGIAVEAAAALIAYAFAAVGLDRVIATTEHANAASIGVMRRLGMRIERNPEPEPAWFQVVGVLAAGAPGR